MRRKDNGAPIKRARLAAGLSQLELAFLVDCSHTTIYLLEKAGPRGMETCSDELATQIARRLNRPVEDLWEARSDARTRSSTRKVTTAKVVTGARSQQVPA